MFKDMRRKDRQLSESESYEILEKGSYGVIGTIGINGYPCATPINYVIDIEKKAIYVHFARKGGQILENVMNNDKVSFTYVGETKLVAEEFVTNYESVMVFGKGEFVEGEEKYNTFVMVVDKYVSHIREAGLQHIDEDIDKSAVLKINIEHITGKARRG